MKLRNKKTGEIQTANSIVITDDREKDGVYVFRSIEQLVEEYEDYKPTEPLIEDEEIREIVRAWADVNDAGKLKYNSDENSLDDIYRNSITFNRGLGLEDEHSYTIPELCGDYEE